MKWGSEPYPLDKPNPNLTPSLNKQHSFLSLHSPLNVPAPAHTLGTGHPLFPAHGHADTPDPLPPSPAVTPKFVTLFFHSRFSRSCGELLTGFGRIRAQFQKFGSLTAGRAIPLIPPNPRF